MLSDITPVILSGGSGTRLWPLSVPKRPKQLQPLFGSQTMIQDTVDRSRGVDGVTSPIVVCNDQQAEEIVNQLTSVGSSPSRLIVEPLGRNTGPAVAAAALVLEPETVMAVFPADHVIVDTEAFRRALLAAVGAARGGRIVTFGIVPTRPDTGFGYIEAGSSHGDIAEVVRFVEKPDRVTAGRYVDAGTFLWNSGMFVFTAGAIRAELERHAAHLLDLVATSVEEATTEGRTIHLGRTFADAPSISIDKAVMELTNRAVVVPLDAGWSDVGSWHSLWEATSPSGGTVVVGDVHVVDVHRSYIRAESRPVAVIGLDDVVVVETPEAVLVMDRRRAQDVRSAAEWFAGLSSEM